MKFEPFTINDRYRLDSFGKLAWKKNLRKKGKKKHYQAVRSYVSSIINCHFMNEYVYCGLLLNHWTPYQV